MDICHRLQVSQRRCGHHITAASSAGSIADGPRKCRSTTAQRSGRAFEPASRPQCNRTALDRMTSRVAFSLKASESVLLHKFRVPKSLCR